MVTQDEHTALRRFEMLYDDWRQATDAWLACELLLWAEALLRPGSAEFRRLGTETTRLRSAARSAYLRVVDALRRSDAG